jgi:hypothetical protein
MAEHHFVIARQVAVLLGSSRGAATSRLQRLERDELIHMAGGFGPNCWLIDRAGLDAIASDLPPPKLNYAHYKHSVGLAWVWLAAWARAFGPVAEVIGERRLRSHDEAHISAVELYSVRLGGYDGSGREHRHYPDVLLVDPHSRRLALELELSPKKIADRREILGGYGADRHLDGVLYLVEANESGRSISRGIRATAAEMGLLDQVHIRAIRPFLALPHVGRSRGAAGATDHAPGRRAPSASNAAGRALGR